MAQLSAASSTWAHEVASRAGIDDASKVEGILREQRIPGASVLPERRRLHLNAVHFSGVKNLPSASGDGSRVHEEFSFTHAFTSGVTAFASLGTNDAGKSSIINVILWGLRGRSNVQADVESWIDQCAIEVAVGDHHLLIAWRPGAALTGEVVDLGVEPVAWDDLTENSLAHFGESAARHRADVEGEARDDRALPIDVELSRLSSRGVIPIAHFEGPDEFARVMDALMMSRLGFEAVEQWTRASNASEDDDGRLVTHSWLLWSQAIQITDSSFKVTLGETATMAGSLLQMYLGTSWGQSVTASRARKGAIDAELASYRRRRNRDNDRLTTGIGELDIQIRDLELELASLPNQSTLDELDAALGRARKAASAVAVATSAWQDLALQLGKVEKELVAAEADELALSEAAVTRRFWHSLRPSCCPRCDAIVDDARWNREQDGNCSLCDSPVELPSVDTAEADSPSDDEEDPDELILAKERTAALIVARGELDLTHDAAKLELNQAEQDLLAARSDQRLADMDPAVRRDAENRLSTLRGRREERIAQVVPNADVVEAETIAKVVDAALAIAKERRDIEQREMLDEVSATVARLGRELGIPQLESATLQGNTHLPVVKGGVSAAFGTLTEGERLRLKIAVVVALLGVGNRAGVGRHPGVLIIDSLAREEINPEDVAALLRQLSVVASENGLQVVTSSANGEVVSAALPAGATRLPDHGDFMW